MPKYVIEREIPGAGKLTAEQLKGLYATWDPRFNGFKAM